MRAETLRIGIVGASGRLGSRLVAACADRGVPVVLTATRTTWEDVPGTPPTVVIDASRGAVLPLTAAYCQRAGAALIACASDLDSEGIDAARALSAQVPVVQATNLSIGHWLQNRLTRSAASIMRRLPDPPVASVLERHTAAKRDRPSASARALAATWETASGEGEVTEVVSYRAGLAVSEHTLDLTFPCETVSLRHDVRDLGAAVFGALAAADWAHDAPVGFYLINDLFDRLLVEESP